MCDKPETMRLLREKARGSSTNSAADVSVSEPDGEPMSVSGRPDRDEVVVSSFTIVGDNNVNSVDDRGNSRCVSVSGSAGPLRCQDERCQRNHEATSVDAQRSTSGVVYITPREVDVSGVTDCVVECGRPEVDEDVCSTTSGSYNAGDLCDEIDQLFFAQDRLKISSRSPSNAINLSN